MLDHRVLADMRCCDAKSAKTRAIAREDSDSERSGASTVSRDDAIDLERGRAIGADEDGRGDAFERAASGSDVSGSHGERGVDGRRSAWHRAAGDEDEDEDGSPTHSTFGRESDRKRRARQTSRLVAERLGGRTSDGSDSDEFASGYERSRTRRGGDEERGFGFVSKADIAKREEEKARQEELERKRAAKAAKEERKRQRREVRRERERELESETASLLDGAPRAPRKRAYFKGSTIAAVVVGAAAVVACGIGAVLYTRGEHAPKMMKIKSGDTTLTTADPALQPLKSTTDEIASRTKGNAEKDLAVDGKVDSDANAEGDDETLNKKTSKSKKSRDADDADEVEEGKTKSKGKKKDEDVDENADDDEDDESLSKSKKSSKKSNIEAMLGSAFDGDIKVTSTCAPVHVESRHGIYRQFNKACMDEGDKPLGCMASSSEGCQSCFVDGSPAATQSTSYARCSHHVCEAFGVRGCDPNPMSKEDAETEVDEKSDVKSDEKSDGEELFKAEIPKMSRLSSAPKTIAPKPDGSGENCLPNLEDAKRGIFQYAERYCRTMGHTDVDYSGCVSIGKSSCRMCVTKSASRSTPIFSVCPRSVCENHDLLFQQCADAPDSA